MGSGDWGTVSIQDWLQSFDQQCRQSDPFHSTPEKRLFLLVHLAKKKKKTLCGWRTTNRGGKKTKKNRVLAVCVEPVRHPTVCFEHHSKINHFKSTSCSSELPAIVHQETYLLLSWPSGNVSFTEDLNVKTQEENLCSKQEAVSCKPLLLLA